MGGAEAPYPMDPMELQNPLQILDVDEKEKEKK